MGVSEITRYRYVFSYDARLIDAIARNHDFAELLTCSFISLNRRGLFSAKYFKEKRERIPPARKSVRGFLLWKPMFTQAGVFKSGSTAFLSDSENTS